MFRETKLDEDIPADSSSESVPISDEVDHGALIVGPTGLCGLVAVSGTPPNGAAIVVLRHGHLQISRGKVSARSVVGCFRRRWATDPTF